MSKAGGKKGKAAKEEGKVQAVSMIDWVSADVKATAGFLEHQVNAKVTFYPGMETMPGVSFGVDIGAMLRPLNPLDGPQRTILYFTINDIQGEIARLAPLGATVHDGPSEVPGMGFWALIHIPGGLTFGLWQSTAPDHNRPAPTKEPHADDTISFIELVAPQPEAAKDFLSDAFGWEFGAWEESQVGAYWYSRGDSKTFSVGVRGAHDHVDAPEVIGFLNVQSVDAALKAVTGKNKAKKLSGKMQMGRFGFSAFVEMPGGIKVGLWENSREHVEEAHEKKEAAHEAAQEKAAPKEAAAPKKKAAAPKKAAAAPKKKAAAPKKAAAAPKKKAAAALAHGRKRASSSGAAGAPAAKKAKK